jgi:hypothetical protein
MLQGELFVDHQTTDLLCANRQGDPVTRLAGTQSQRARAGSQVQGTDLWSVRPWHKCAGDLPRTKPKGLAWGDGSFGGKLHRNGFLLKLQAVIASPEHIAIRQGKASGGRTLQ